MSFKPLGNKVLVKLIENMPEDNKTKSGIYLPEKTKQDWPMQGTVIEVGPGHVTKKGETIRPIFSPGDIVVFGAYTGHEKDLDGEKHILIPENELLGRLTPTGEVEESNVNVD